MQDMFSRFMVSEEDIVRQQVEEDLQLYGSRPRPPDAVDNGESIQTENRIPKRNASMSEATADSPAKLSKSEHSITFDGGAITAMDWNSGASPLDAWLNQSAIPSTATSIELPDQPDSVDDLVAQEVEEIKFFRNVHLPTASNTEEKETAVDEFEGLELAGQIYYRNIRDRYPLLPMYLARRLAQANYQRSERFRSGWLTSEQPVKQAAVQPHPVLNAFSCTGGASSSLTQMASDVPAKSKVIEVVDSTHQVIHLAGEVPVDVQPTYQMMTLDTENGPIQVPVDALAASKVADEKRKRNATASLRFRQRRKQKELESAQTIQKLEHRVYILCKMKNTRKVEDYLCIRPGNTKAQASFIVEEVVGSNPPLFSPGSKGSTQSPSIIDAFSAPHADESPKYNKTPSDRFRARRKQIERYYAQTIQSLEKQIHEWEADMKNYEWCQNPTAPFGTAHSLVKSTTKLVDELMTQKFAEAGNISTSSTLSSQISPSPAYRFATQSPEPISDNQITTVDSVSNGTTPNPLPMVSPPRPDSPIQTLNPALLSSLTIQRPTSLPTDRMPGQSPAACDAPPCLPFMLPRDRKDHGLTKCKKCKNCKTVLKAPNGNGEDLSCLCLKRKSHVSRHYNYTIN